MAQFFLFNCFIFRKKFILILISLLFTKMALAAPVDKLPIMVSRANCYAVTPVGIGNHNESFSYYVNDKADMWVRTFQTSKQGSTRALQSSAGLFMTGVFIHRSLIKEELLVLIDQLLGIILLVLLQ